MLLAKMVSQLTTLSGTVKILSYTRSSRDIWRQLNIKQSRTHRAVFKWLSKNQNQSSYSDQSQQVHGATGFGFASHWLKNWRESFKPITKRSNRNHVITFDSYLKTALKVRLWWSAWRGSQRFVKNVGFVFLVTVNIIPYHLEHLTLPSCLIPRYRHGTTETNIKACQSFVNI